MASPVVSAGEILASLIMFVIVYALMFALWLHLIRKAVIKGPDPLQVEPPVRAVADEAEVAR